MPFAYLPLPLRCGLITGILITLFLEEKLFILKQVSSSSNDLNDLQVSSFLFSEISVYHSCLKLSSISSLKELKNLFYHFF